MNRMLKPLLGVATCLGATSLLAQSTIAFQATFDVPSTDPVPVRDTSWAVHHSFLGRVVTAGPLHGITPQNLSASPGDPLAGTPNGYLSIFINNGYNVDSVSTYGKDAASPGAHPDTGLIYSNRTLSILAWTSTVIDAGTRADLSAVTWFQGNRDASFHSFLPAVRIGNQWYTYTMTPTQLNAIRERGSPENVFSGGQMIGPNAYNAQYYNWAWSETGWSVLNFSGTIDTDSPSGLSLGAALDGALPAGDITGVGMFSPENITSPTDLNGHRLDSVTFLAIPEPSTYTMAALGLLAALAFVRRRR